MHDIREESRQWKIEEGKALYGRMAESNFWRIFTLSLVMVAWDSEIQLNENNSLATLPITPLN